MCKGYFSLFWCIFFYIELFHQWRLSMRDCVWEIAWHVYLQLFYIFVCVCCLNCLFIRHYFWGCMCYIQYEMFYFFFIAFVVIILIINYWGVFTKLCPLILNFFSFCSFYPFYFMSRSEGLKMLFFNSPSNMIGLWHSLITGNNVSCFFTKPTNI